MLKKRIIFTLLYNAGNFVLSRNFRLQRVGNLSWLQKNYNFSDVSFYIDELVVLDVTRGTRDTAAFCETLKALSKGCFVPIAAGGGVRSLSHAQDLLRSGADKVVVNTPIIDHRAFLIELSKKFGQQCVVGSLDLKRTSSGEYKIWLDSGTRPIEHSAAHIFRNLDTGSVGEWYLNSIDQDGTGQGLDLGILDLLPPTWQEPVILAGGSGNQSHLFAGLLDPRVDAVATAHLLNFVGDGLKQARTALSAANVDLASWPELEPDLLRL